MKGYMSALMSDLVQGKINASIGNAACSAASRLLKVVELEHRYGKTGGPGESKTVVLSADD
jgi:hypothetical protein